MTDSYLELIKNAPGFGFLALGTILLMVGLSLWAWRLRNRWILTVGAWTFIFIILIYGLDRIHRSQSDMAGFWKTSQTELAKALAVSAQELHHYDIKSDTPEDDPTYRVLHDTFFRWQEENEMIFCIYSARKDDQGGVRLIVSPPADTNGDGEIDLDDPLEATDPIGTLYDEYHGEFDTIFSGREQSTFMQVPLEDRWGIYISVGVPIYDAQGNFDAVLGIDFRDNEYRALILEPGRAHLLTAAMALGIVIVAYVALSLLLHSLEKTQSINADLLEARHAAESASRAKTDFLANMSHEIRTPMNAILGFLDVLLVTDSQAKSREERAEITQIIRNNANSLLGILNNILDITMVEANRLSLTFAAVSPADVLREIREKYHNQAANKGLKLALTIDPSVPDRIISDPIRLRQIVAGLVENAVKFTEKGRVAIRCDAERITDDVPSLIDQTASIAGTGSLSQTGTGQYEHILLKIEVSDTGIGIPKEKQPLIFQPFMQADTSLTRTYGGTGLGLSVAKRLADMLEGELECQSAPGQGATFLLTLKTRLPLPNESTFTLPSSVAEHLTQVSRSAKTKGGASWSTVTSQRTPQPARSSVKTVSSSSVPVASSVSTSVVPTPLPSPGIDPPKTREPEPRSLHAATPGTLLREMDGPAAEALEPQDSDIPDTVELRPVSSSAKERSWSSSGTSLTDSDFASLTDRTADDEMTVDGNADDHEMASALNGYRILLVEDVAINQLLISFQLRDSGATVDVAENGQVGLDRIRHEESEGRHYDAILMDMQMPVLDGYEATRILRRQGYRRPIIALTAHALAGDREKTLECGCDDYATKPIDRAVLIDLISHCVSVSR